MTTGHGPSLTQQLAASRATRVTFGVMALVIVALLAIGAFAAGAVHATESRFESIEKMIAEDRGRRSRDEWTDRDVLDRLTTIEATQGASGLMLKEVRDDVKAIRDAVAPLPRAKE